MRIPERPDSPGGSHHLSVRPTGDGPAEARFLFEEPRKRFGGAVGVSVATHVGMVLLVVLLIRLIPERKYEIVAPPQLSDRIIWLADPGPGGGGGGGGNRTPEPPKKAELPGKEAITVPVVKPAPVVAPKPEPTPDPPLEAPVTIPVQTMAAAETTAPGLIDAGAASVASRGTGTGSGAGTGSGSGIGAGEGSGLGEGSGGGTGGGVYQPGNGVSLPQLVREVRPIYTTAAMTARLQGRVMLECVVLPDGSVGRVKVVRSLDSNFGLDEEAIKAARQWRFRPGTRKGEPVAVVVNIELSFTLR